MIARSSPRLFVCNEPGSLSAKFLFHQRASMTAGIRICAHSQSPRVPFVCPPYPAAGGSTALAVPAGATICIHNQSARGTIRDRETLASRDVSMMIKILRRRVVGDRRCRCGLEAIVDFFCSDVVRLDGMYCSRSGSRHEVLRCSSCRETLVDRPATTDKFGNSKEIEEREESRRGRSSAQSFVNSLGAADPCIPLTNGSTSDLLAYGDLSAGGL